MSLLFDHREQWFRVVGGELPYIKTANLLGIFSLAHFLGLLSIWWRFANYPERGFLTGASKQTSPRSAWCTEPIRIVPESKVFTQHLAVSNARHPHAMSRRYEHPPGCRCQSPKAQCDVGGALMNGISAFITEPQRAPSPLPPSRTWKTALTCPRWHPESWTSSLWDSEKPLSVVYQLHSLWYFVTVARKG